MRGRESILILGSTGLLGQALVKEAERLQLDYLGVSRNTPTISVDAKDTDALIKLVRDYKPTVVINTIALVSLAECEFKPLLAEEVNAAPAHVLTELANELGFYLVQISTDHYFQGDKNRKHAEDDPVTLLNEYAKTKYRAEGFALQNHDACVIRTNIVGFRGRPGVTTFVETVVDSFEHKKPFTMFSDYYTSSIDVASFSKALFTLLPKRPKGILNLASSEVFSKQQFVESLAKKLDVDLSFASVGSVFDMKTDVQRAESLGLDVTNAERILGYSLPTLDNVTESLARELNVQKGQKSKLVESLPV